MKLPINIEVQDDDNSECGRNCPFLAESNLCLLFSEVLAETKLPEGWVWQDDAIPTNQRCYRCMLIKED